MLKMVWDCGINMLTFVSIILMFLTLGFGFELLKLTKVLELAIDYIFIADIGLTFFSAIEIRPGHIIHRPTRIAYNYLKSNFLLDGLPTLPFACTNGIILNLYYFKLIRILKITNTFSKLEKILGIGMAKWTKQN